MAAAARATDIFPRTALRQRGFSGLPNANNPRPHEIAALSTSVDTRTLPTFMPTTNGLATIPDRTIPTTTSITPGSTAALLEALGLATPSG